MKASPGSLRRWSLKLGEAAARFEREEVEDGKPLETRMYLSIDGTGIPMRKEETEGVRGKQADGTSKSREAKLAVIYTAGGGTRRPARFSRTGAARASAASSTARRPRPGAGSPRTSPRGWSGRRGVAGFTTPAGPSSSPTGRSGYGTPARSSSGAGRSHSCPVSSTASNTRPAP